MPWRTISNVARQSVITRDGSSAWYFQSKASVMSTISVALWSNDNQFILKAGLTTSDLAMANLIHQCGRSRNVHAGALRDSRATIFWFSSISGMSGICIQLWRLPAYTHWDTQKRSDIYAGKRGSPVAMGGVAGSASCQEVALLTPFILFFGILVELYCILFLFF